MGMTQATFDKLEQDFQKVLNEMVGDRTMQ
jgi:hypothetical protein